MDRTTQSPQSSLNFEQVYDRASLVEKEAVQNLKFPAEEVLTLDKDVKARARKIHRATSLGNLEKHKVTIVFEDADNLKKISTTIWAQTEKKIVLKGGMSIPVHRIWDVVI